MDRKGAALLSMMIDNQEDDQLSASRYSTCVEVMVKRSECLQGRRWREVVVLSRLKTEFSLSLIGD